MGCLRGSASVALAAMLAVPLPVVADEVPEVDHEHIERIVVTATPRQRSTDELAAPIAILEREHLLEHVGSTLGESLSHEPGIAASGFAPGASRPVIRGQDAFRVRILENGIGTHDVSLLSADHGVPLNPLVQQRVEILRGPGTLRYGGGAIGGVVNALNDRVPQLLPDAAIGGELLGGYGTNAEQEDVAALLDGSLGSLAWHLDGVRRRSNDYGLPETSRDERFTDSDGYALAGGLAWIGERGRVGIGLSRFSNEYGIPAPAKDPLSIDLEAERVSFEADLELPEATGLEALRLRGAYTVYEHKEVEGGRAVGSTFDNQEWETRLEALHRPIAGFAGAIGVHVQDRDLTAAGEGGALLAPSEATSWALYAFEERELNQSWSLQLAARVERTELEGTPFDDRRRKPDFTPLSGSLGLVYRPAEGASLGLSLAASQRAPDTLELFARGPHEATETFEIGDPGLGEDTAFSVDLRAHAHRERWEGELNVFYTHYGDYTFGRFTGRSRGEDGTSFSDPDAGELLELVYAQDEATFYGAEARGHYDLVEGAGGSFGLDAQFDFVRGRLDRGNVPRIPPIGWGGGVYFTHPRVSARVGFQRWEEQDKLGEFETKTSGYTYVNASLTLVLLDAGGPLGLEVNLTASNLLDEKGRNHVSFKKDDVVLPGRDLRVTLRGRF